MRTPLSILFTVLGIAGIYLFATGAASEPFWTAGGWEQACQRVAWPLRSAGFVSSAVLTAGLISFLAGVFASPRGGVWIVRSSDRDGLELGRVEQLSSEVTTDKVLKIILAFNVLVVAAISAFLCAAVSGSTRPEVLGALYVAAAAEVVLGFCLATYLRRTRKSRPRKFQLVAPVTAGLNIIEAVWLAVILFAGLL